MKRSPHFREEDYTEWHQASRVTPSRKGWYECVGWRFNGYLHLYWNGSAWEYWGPKHVDPKFPQFGQHKTDSWRGLLNSDPRHHAGPKCVDITGQIFGMLRADRSEYVTRKGAHWRFICECGTQRVLRQQWVTSGNTGSCGCRQHVRGAIPIKRPWSKK